MAKAKGAAVKKCHISTHEDDAFEWITDLFNRKRVPGPVSQYIIDNKLIKYYPKASREHNICSKCVEHFTLLVQHPPKRQKSLDNSASQDVEVPECNPENELNVVTSALENDSLTSEQLQKLCDAVVGKFRRELLATQQSDRPTRLDDIHAISYEQVWQNLPDTTLKHLLQSFASSDGDRNANFRKLVKCFEIIRSISEPRFVSNTSLGEALLLMNFSHSKMALELLSKQVPTGSYSLLRKTMAEIGGTPNLLPENDVVLAFDNSQVVPRTWSIKFMGKQVASIVTAMIYFNLGTSSKHQYNLSIPTALFPSKSNQPILLSKYQDFAKKSIELHREYRKFYMQSCLLKVIEDCKLLNQNVVDSVTAHVTNKSVFMDAFAYNRVEKTPRVTPIGDLDCLNLNPNSYASVTTVLETILNYLEGSQRKWIITYMDGCPYGLALKLIAETYLCAVCNATVSSSEIKTHEKKHKEAVGWSRKFKKIIIRPGNGHVELTLTKTILSFFWVPFIKPIVELMGFSSDRQLEYIKKGYDHHKAYNTLMVALSAYSYELMYPYVRQQLLNKVAVTYEGYCKWAADVSKTNLTYKMASDFTYTTLHGLQLFRSAIRECNDQVAFSSRHQLCSLLYVSPSVKYQQFMIHDTLYMLSLSKEARDRMQMESSRSGAQGAGEGFDFLLENRNKLYKSLLPENTTPTFQNWLQVVRTAGEYEKLRESAAQRLEMAMSKSKNEFQNSKFDLEVMETRRFIRSTMIFEMKTLGFVTVDDNREKLDETWTDFIQIATKNQNMYASSYTQNEMPKLASFVLGIADPDFQNASENEIKVATEKKIQGLNEPFQSFYKNAMKTKKSKAELKEFFQTVNKQVDYQVQVDLSLDMEEDFCRVLNLLHLIDDD